MKQAMYKQALSHTHGLIQKKVCVTVSTHQLRPDRDRLATASLLISDRKNLNVKDQLERIQWQQSSTH
jgi:hypothetical protein